MRRLHKQICCHQKPTDKHPRKNWSISQWVRIYCNILFQFGSNLISCFVRFRSKPNHFSTRQRQARTMMTCENHFDDWCQSWSKNWANATRMFSNSDSSQFGYNLQFFTHQLRMPPLRSNYERISNKREEHEWLYVLPVTTVLTLHSQRQCTAKCTISSLNEL